MSSKKVTTTEWFCDVCSVKIDAGLPASYKSVAGFSGTEPIELSIVFRCNFPHQPAVTPAGWQTDICLPCRVKMMEQAIIDYKKELSSD